MTQTVTDLLKSQILLYGHPTCIETIMCCCFEEILCVTLAMQWLLQKDTEISFNIQIPCQFSISVNQDYKLKYHNKGNKWTILLGWSIKNESLVPKRLVTWWCSIIKRPRGNQTLLPKSISIDSSQPLPSPSSLYCSSPMLDNLGFGVSMIDGVGSKLGVVVSIAGNGRCGQWEHAAYLDGAITLQSNHI